MSRSGSTHVFHFAECTEPNLYLRRGRCRSGVFWFRNPISMHRSMRHCGVCGSVSRPGQNLQTCTLLISYDGSNVSHLYMQGEKRGSDLPCSALGARLWCIMSRASFGAAIYRLSRLVMILTFIPAGLLLGMIARKEPPETGGGSLLHLGSGAAYFLRNLILVWVSGRGFFVVGNNFVPVLTLLGAWLMLSALTRLSLDLERTNSCPAQKRRPLQDQPAAFQGGLVEASSSRTLRDGRGQVCLLSCHSALAAARPELSWQRRLPVPIVHEAKVPSIAEQ